MILNCKAYYHYGREISAKYGNSFGVKDEWKRGQPSNYPYLTKYTLMNAGLFGVVEDCEVSAADYIYFPENLPRKDCEDSMCLANFYRPLGTLVLTNRSDLFSDVDVEQLEYLRTKEYKQKLKLYKTQQKIKELGGVA